MELLMNKTLNINYLKTPIKLLASLIWNTSETLDIPLGRFAPTVFGLMIGVKKNGPRENI